MNRSERPDAYCYVRLFWCFLSLIYTSSVSRLWLMSKPDNRDSYRRCLLVIDLWLPERYVYDRRQGSFEDTRYACIDGRGRARATAHLSSDALICETAMRNNLKWCRLCKTSVISARGASFGSARHCSLCLKCHAFGFARWRHRAAAPLAGVSRADLKEQCASLSGRWWNNPRRWLKSVFLALYY